MGNSYCLSPDKKAVQNELTVINVQEENLEEKKNSDNIKSKCKFSC